MIDMNEKSEPEYNYDDFDYITVEVIFSLIVLQ